MGCLGGKKVPDGYLLEAQMTRTGRKQGVSSRLSAAKLQYVASLHKDRLFVIRYACINIKDTEDGD